MSQGAPTLQPMRVHQSDLKTFNRCPLLWKFENLDPNAPPGIQMSASTWGSIMHEAVLLLEETKDLDLATAQYQRWWEHPEKLDASYEITEWIRGDSYPGLRDKGVAILRDWWSIIRWEADVVVAREHHFLVPYRDGIELEGTADKVAIRYNPKLDEEVVLISDYKTARRQPTYSYLSQDMQFSMYAMASESPEFWTMDNGEELYERYKDAKRWGEWVHLRGPRRLDAGERNEGHYARLKYAIDGFVQSVGLRIFVPVIDGQVCCYCGYREYCGLPSREAEGLE